MKVNSYNFDVDRMVSQIRANVPGNTPDALINTLYKTVPLIDQMNNVLAHYPDVEVDCRIVVDEVQQHPVVMISASAPNETTEDDLHSFWWIELPMVLLNQNAEQASAPLELHLKVEQIKEILGGFLTDESVGIARPLVEFLSLFEGETMFRKNDFNEEGFDDVSSWMVHTENYIVGFGWTQNGLEAVANGFQYAHPIQ